MSSNFVSFLIIFHLISCKNSDDEIEKSETDLPDSDIKRRDVALFAVSYPGVICRVGKKSDAVWRS